VRDGLFNIYVRNVKREWKIYLFTDLVVITKPKKNIIGQDARDHYKSTVSLGNARLVDLADSEGLILSFLSLLTSLSLSSFVAVGRPSRNVQSAKDEEDEGFFF